MEKIKTRDKFKMKDKERLSKGGKRDKRGIYIFTGQLCISFIQQRLVQLFLFIHNIFRRGSAIGN